MNHILVHLEPKNNMQYGPIWTNMDLQYEPHSCFARSLICYTNPTMQKPSSPNPEKKTAGKKSLIIVVAILGLITALLMAAKTKNSIYTSSVKLMHNKQTAEYRKEMFDEMEERGMPGAEIDTMMRDSDTGVGNTNTIANGLDVMEPNVESGIARKDTPSKTTALGMLPPSYPYPGNDDALNINERVYEKYSSHSLVVKDVSDYMRQIKEYILSVEGRVLTSNLSSSGKYTSGYLQAKVPVAKFEESQTRITNDIKEIVAENINAQDRTGQLVNTQEKLKSLQDQKLELEIKLDEAKTDAEKRRLELQISRIETQIKNADKQVENVENKVEYANISIYAADDARYFNPSASPNLGSEFEQAWESISDIFFLVARLGIWVVVYGLLWLPLVLIFGWVVKKKT